MRPETLIKRQIRQRVRAVFDSGGAGRYDFSREGPGLFAEDAAAREVHGDVTTMMIGGVAALLMQMLHPGALAGVWDHSAFRRDMLARLRATAEFIAVTTYGVEAEAERAIARVRSIHDRVNGTLPDGTPYDANDPKLLAWVHVTEVWAFLNAFRRYRRPGMSGAFADRYYAENRIVAAKLGAPDVPVSRAEVEAYFRYQRRTLRYDRRTAEVARALLSHRADPPAMQPAQDLIARAAIDLLPDWARRMHGKLRLPGESTLVRLGAAGMTRTLRWAMTG